ncbi:type II secretion system protein E [Desulfofundulus kuznetsovii DSM 6115]|uniref:Type II secretion system protein E n=1 Tax=Desulfofundulus kuznetsovii (strain DSM 6115 / VKM B-1805 / 17) TaxID=760568 RepID=A0AAU8PNW4_DESK7|nr:type II secretion system protein E [Desulfofundulus kuznetsovii DSM 6115]
MDIRLGEKHLHEATAIIQELLADPRVNTEELEKIFWLAKAGYPGYDVKAREAVESLMKKYGLTVSGMPDGEAAQKIYEYLWGLDVVESLYRMPHVNEIRVNGPRKIYYQYQGKNMRAEEICFKDSEHIRKIIARMLEHDRAYLDESNPGCESRRLDGTRLTALTYPVTKEPCFILRKHGTFDMSQDNYIESGTMSEYILNLLVVLVKGRANILISGSANTGKTTLLRFLVKYLHPRLRIVTLETDRELFLDEWYPDRDIISLEAHPELGWDMRRCFVIVLRLSPNVIIVGEARGIGEAGQMINAVRSGHTGMGTLHTLSVYEAVSTLALMALEEGRKLPVPLLEDQIASGFDVIIQMYGNDVTGTIRIEHVVEVSKGKNGPEFRDLCIWEPSNESYEQGKWRYPCGISEMLAQKLFKFGVTRSELEQLEGMRANA